MLKKSNGKHISCAKLYDTKRRGDLCEMGCFGGESLPVDWKMVEGSGKSMVSRGIAVSQSMAARKSVPGGAWGECPGLQSQEPCTALVKQLCWL